MKNTKKLKVVLAFFITLAGSLGPCFCAGASTLQDFIDSNIQDTSSEAIADAPLSTLNSYPRPDNAPFGLYPSNDGVLDKYLSVDGVTMPVTANSSDHADDRMQSYPYRLAAVLDAIKANITDQAIASDMLNETVSRTSFTLSGYHTDDVQLPSLYTTVILDSAWEYKLSPSFEESLGYLADSETIYEEAYIAGINIALEMVYYSKYYGAQLASKYGIDVSDLSSQIDEVDAANLAALYEAAEIINKEFAVNGIAVPLIETYWNAPGLGRLPLREYAIAAEADGWDYLYETVSNDYTADVSQPLTDFYSLQFTQEDIASAVLQDFTGNANEKIQIQLSDYIVKGISYSSSYIPMQTNVYSADTLASYDDAWLRDFHYKYGYMRKALVKSTSSTAAMDIYNTNNTTRGTTEVCTLRDFLECGDSDLVLYIDDDFYNEANAVKYAMQVLDERKEELKEYKQLIDDYVSALNQSSSTPAPSYAAPSYAAASAASASSTSAYPASNASSYPAKMFLEIKSEELLKILGRSEGMRIEDLMRISNKLREALRGTYISYPWESVLKTGSNTSYNDKLRSSLAENEDSGYRRETADNVYSDNLDIKCLPSSKINQYLKGVTVRVESNADADTDSEITTYDEYTELLSYAYVSAIYRDAYTYSVSSSKMLDSPVFVSSKDLCGVADAEQYYKNSLLNYMLVKNLNSMVHLNYTYSLDMDSPVYMDIYGNILTESGLVVIPAASNASLYVSDYNNIIASMGLFTAYGRDYYVPTSLAGSEQVLSGMFTPDPEGSGVWIIDGLSYQVEGTVVDYANLSAYTTGARNAAIYVFDTYLRQNSVSTYCVTPLFINIINEVMRGAPIGYIDKVDEELVKSSFISKSAVTAGAKLEALIDSLNSKISNTLLVIPDFTTMDSTEYIVGFCFKLLIAAVVVVVIISIYRDAVDYSLGLHTIKQVGFSVALTFIAVAVIPAVFQLTYYAANKFLLQDEVTRIAMYNLEKKEGGVEVGVTELRAPSDSNKLMVQLDWVTVPWYRQMEHMMFNDSIENISIAREEAFKNSSVSMQDDVTLYNDGVYMSVDDIFDSVGIDYTFLTDDIAAGAARDTSKMLNGLYVYTKGTEQTLSFYSPYYVFLYALTADVNSYNYVNDSYVYTTKMVSGNRLKTVGLSYKYFTSLTFMEEDYDPLHLYEIYGVTPEDRLAHADIFSIEEKIGMRSSVWYNPLKYKDLEKRIAICTDYCRKFVADNKDLLDKVTDETFLKVMALTMAMKYNQVFGITTANCYEIYNIDSNDLLRICMAGTSDVMLSSTLSYSRFVMTYGGEMGVYAAALLVMIMYIGSFIKPLCVIVSFLSVFISIFVFKVVLRRENMSLYGYFITVCLLSGTNILHAIMLKASTILPKLGLSLFWCCFFMFIMQVSYLLILAYVTGTAMTDLHDLGFNRYKTKYDRMAKKSNKQSRAALSGSIPQYKDNHEYLEALYRQHRSRGGRLE